MSINAVVQASPRAAKNLWADYQKTTAGKMWKYFRVVLQVNTRLCGGIPKSEKVREKWLSAVIADKTMVRTLVDETNAQMGEVSDETQQVLDSTGWNGFKQNGDGLYYEGRCLKSAFKEAANVLKDQLDVAMLKSKVSERVFVVEERLSLGKSQPDGTIERAIHVMTARGPRDSIKLVDYVDQPVITATIQILDEPLTLRDDGSKKEKASRKKLKPEAYLMAMLEYMQYNGIGADRSQSEGKFTVLEVSETEAP